MSFLSLLTLLFIGLKLTGNVDWNWFWVMSPMAIPVIFVFTIAMLKVLIERL